MTSSCVRAGGLIIALALAAAGTGCSGGQAPAGGLVANPFFQAWSGFEPGTSVTMDGERKIGGNTECVRITDRLVEKTADRIVYEHAVAPIPSTAPAEVTRRVEPRLAEPTAHWRTRPGAKITELGDEAVAVDGRTLSCHVRQTDVHVEYGDPAPSREDFHLVRWACDAVPGGTAKMVMDRKSSSHSLEMSLQVVDFHIVGREKP